MQPFLLSDTEDEEDSAKTIEGDKSSVNQQQGNVMQWNGARGCYVLVFGAY